MTHTIADPPEGILVVENYLGEEQISLLRKYADGQIGIISKVELAREDGKLSVTRHEGFSSDRIDVRPIHDTAISICDDIFCRIVPEHYGVKIERYEYPHILRYRKGGNYKAHSDAESWDPVAKKWDRTIDRDYSAVVYFNNEFEGGELCFTGFKYRIKPERGMLVCFPSGGAYTHTAEPVTSGNRYALVTWSAAHGTPRILEKPAGEVVYLDCQGVGHLSG